MDHLRSALRTLYDGVWKAVDQALIVLCSVMVVAVFLQVIFRYVLHLSLSWSEELARYAFTWLAMLGAAVAMRRRSHFVLEVLVRWIPARIAGPLMVFAGLVVFVFLLVLTVEGVLWMIAYSDMVSPVMQIGYYMVAASIPISGGLMATECVLQLGRAIARIRKGGPVLTTTAEPETNY